MNDDINLLFFQDAEINLAKDRYGIPKKYILKVRGNHGTTPAIRQGTAGRRKEQALVVLINTHMRAVHQLHHLPVNATGHYP